MHWFFLPPLGLQAVPGIYLMDRQEIFDQADEMDLARWYQIDLENEREQMTWEALDACLKAGVSVEHLKTLARETGCARWIQNLLKSLKEEVQIG
jgi:hypothetical protein